MKKIFKNWRRLLNEAKEQPLETYPVRNKKVRPAYKGPPTPPESDGKAKIGPKGLSRQRMKHGSRSIYEKPPKNEGHEESFSDETHLVATEMEKGMLGRKQLIDILMSDDRFEKKSYSKREMDMIWQQASEMMRDM